jgi:hypothetical protein
MNLPEDLAESECRYSSALLAIHSAISYGDALCAGMTDRGAAAQDHGTLAPRLEKLLNESGYSNKQGIVHLRNLLGYKTRVAYEAASVTVEEAKLMVDRAKRFSVWANVTGSKLNIEGWRDE